MPILLVAACKDEILPCLDLFRKAHLPCLSFTTGIGPLHASFAHHKLQKLAFRKHVLYIGTAGSSSPWHGPHLITASEVHWLPTAERLGWGKHFPTLHPKIPVTPGPLSENLPTGTVLTSTTVSLTEDLSCKPIVRPSWYENMEAYPIVHSILPIAQSLNIIMGVSNRVGPHASKQWFTSKDQLASMTAEHLRKQLDTLRDFS